MVEDTKYVQLEQLIHFRLHTGQYEERGETDDAKLSKLHLILGYLHGHAVCLLTFIIVL